MKVSLELTKLMLHVGWKSLSLELNPESLCCMGIDRIDYECTKIVYDILYRETVQTSSCKIILLMGHKVTILIEPCIISV